MVLVGYQQRYFDKLYSAVVDDEWPFILFSAPKGCGKSFITEMLAQALQENWKVFHIEGLGTDKPPYSTWAQTAYPHGRFGLQLKSVSFSLSFKPVSQAVDSTSQWLKWLSNTSVGVNLAFERNTKFLNDNEQAILKAINKEAGSAEKILIIADRYSCWDQASREMLLKLAFLSETNLSEHRKIHFIYVDTESDTSFFDSISINIKEYDIPKTEITEADIKHIVAANPSIDVLKINDLNRIMSYTGYDLDLISLAVKYEQSIQSVHEITSLSKLLEKRIAQLGDEQKEVAESLKQISIINMPFSDADAATLLKQGAVDTEILLDDATDLLFINKHADSSTYEFPDDEIQQFFMEQLEQRRKAQHHSFAKYLQQAYPSDYTNRAYHLKMSGRVNNDSMAIPAAYLLAIESIRRKELTGGVPDENLNALIIDYLDGEDDIASGRVMKQIDALSDGFDHYNRCEYEMATECLARIKDTMSTPAFIAEKLRLDLLCYVQMANNRTAIKKRANTLYNRIQEDDFLEDELWCRAALLLLSVYTDRFDVADRVEALHEGFVQRIGIHPTQDAFSELERQYYRKAALFCKPSAAVDNTQDCCKDYEDINSVPNLYMCLCNNAANRIICGDYIVAGERLDHCTALEKEMENPPSPYKVANNSIINTFLSNEGHDYTAMDRGKLIQAAADASREFDKLIEDLQSNSNEVSHVMEFNQISMLMLSGEKERAENLLDELQYVFDQLDDFYLFYYHNARTAMYILNGQFPKAGEQLTLLKNQKVALLDEHSDAILNERVRMFRTMIKDEFAGDAFELNYAFLKNGVKPAYSQDKSLRYWWRAFLLSDMQFLSM